MSIQDLASAIKREASKEQRNHEELLKAYNDLLDFNRKLIKRVEQQKKQIKKLKEEF